MGKKAIIALFCISLQLCAAEIVYQQEKPTNKIKSAVMQPGMTDNSDQKIVLLDDNSVWQIYPCNPKLYSYCDHYRKETLDQIDPRFTASEDDWTGIHNVDIYNYPFQTSAASQIINPQFPSDIAHLLVNTDTNKITFVYPLTKQLNLGYKIYGPKQIKDNFNGLIGGNFLKSSIKKRLSNPMMIVGSEGSGRKTLVRALAKENNKVLIEVDLSVDRKEFMKVAMKNKGAMVMFYGLQAKDELHEMISGLLKDVANNLIPQKPKTTLSEQIYLLTTYHGAQCFVIVDRKTATEFPNFAGFSMPQITLQQRMQYLSSLLGGFNDLDEISELTENCTFGDLQKIVSIAQINSPEMSQDALIDAAEKLSIIVDLEAKLPSFITLKDLDENGHTISDLFVADQIKSQLYAVSNSMVNYESYKPLNISPPNTLLLTGPSGVGKTTAIEALAHESKRTLIYIEGSKLWEAYLEDDIHKLEDLFEYVSVASPCILCIDGLDHYPVMQQLRFYDFIMTPFAREMEQSQKLKDLFLVITANSIENLHGEVLQKSRTGFCIHTPLPQREERTLIIKHIMGSTSIDFDCDIEKIVNLTQGFSITDIKDLFTIAGQSAAQDKLSYIPYKMLETACKRIILLKSHASSSKGSTLSISDPTKAPITFADIGGCIQAKEDMKEVIAFLKNPKIYGQLGVRPPKGILFQGPSGCGKTLLAKAVAGEANCSFFYCSGSELQGYYVNENIVLIKRAFEQARANAPAILFIDEIDAIGGKRSNRDSSSASMYAHGVNQLLSEMDGFQSADGVVVMGATNFAESLDPALMRPGRFDRKIAIGYPNLKERQEILEIHAKKRSLNAEIDMNYLARICIGMSGADLESMVNEAALSAGREQRTSITLSDLQDARDRVLMGRENKSIVLTEKEKRDTAYHEAGHTVVGLYLNCSMVIDKVTITPRGFALGLTWSVPEGEHVSDFRSKLKGDLAQALGGYAAEKMFLHDTSSGVSSDLQQANKLARRMVCEWGMSDALGFLVDHKNASPETKRLVDVEVQRFLGEAYSEACAVLEEHRDVVEQIVDELLEKEMLYREDLDRIMAEHA
ncbi:MAG: ATP-dependent zinc metalloprotease FtsH [Chlamydiales bacterium]|nr:ATP-dependent zinc metalloprotease FtsH [Chlamydiales bacterium]